MSSHVSMAGAAAGIGQYVAFFWQPTYYVEVYSGELRNASLYSTLPWVASAVFTNVAGWVADALIARSALTLTAVRKLMEGLSCFGAAACLLLMAFLPKVSCQQMMSAVFQPVCVLPPYNTARQTLKHTCRSRSLP